jgi:outer membrane receptor protein involved in Fe transport
MLMTGRLAVFAFAVFSSLAASSAPAEEVRGTVTDTLGSPLQGARITLRDLASGSEESVSTDSTGRYSVRTRSAGTFLLTVERERFSAAARTIVVQGTEQTVDQDVRLDLGVLRDEVTVTATRSDRETRQVPLRVESMSRPALERSNPASTGDALVLAANVTPVGNGPFGVRPRLRGLDSTRLLVLVDGERLNTARQATDRTGAEVGLVSMDNVERVEIVNGAGTLLYGSDALAGAINVVTREATFSPTRRFLYGGSGYWSGNENGARGSLTLGAVGPRHAVRAQAGAEAFDDYEAGSLDVEDTRPFFTSGTLRRADTVDDAFGFSFRAFPDPFNAPYVRTSAEVPNSQAHGHFVLGSGLFAVKSNTTLRVRYQRRRMSEIGFPDFAAPYFFNATALPGSALDRFSARLETRAVRPWLQNLSVAGYFQKTERTLENRLPVQFPAPTAVSFFPINVMRLDTVSTTRQSVRTPGLDFKAVLKPHGDHILTAGAMVYSDRSEDTRTSTSQMSLVGVVALGARGPAAQVFPSLVPLGPPTVTSPSRVPDARLTNLGVFLQDEWRPGRDVSVVFGVRADRYSVASQATPGYVAAALLAGAKPAIDPSTQPDPAGASYSRHAVTADLGVVFRPDAAISPFARYGRSYRHPNLEEMFFSGPATVATIVPNVKVKPETGDNFDAGFRFRAGRASGGVFAFLNSYTDFIAQDLVVAMNGTSAIAQAVNYADARITGVEGSIDAPFVARRGVLVVQGSAAFMRGTITRGTNPFDGSTFDDSPLDNITPSKIALNVRYTEPRGRFFAEYGVRHQGEVKRVARTLLHSSFLIAQDLLSLDAFTVHRVAAGVHLMRDRLKASLTVALENAGNLYYREHFQFAPSRGRSLTVGLNISGL